MKPPPLTYHRPATIDEAVALLGEHGDDAKVIAGGQSLVPLLNLRLAAPEQLIDVMHAPGLRGIAYEDGWVSIGAGVRQAEAEDDPIVQEHLPLLAEALPWVAHREIRNAGTICGSTAHADSASEIPCVTRALGARMVLRGTGGTREIDADDFFTGFLTTVAEPEELLVSLRLPAAAPGEGFAFSEVSQQRGNYGLAGVGTRVRVDDGRISEARVAYLGVETIPARVSEVEDLLVGAEPSDEVYREAGARAAQALQGIASIHASAAYRASLAETLTRRVLNTAVGRALEATA
jgi:CO/xanthine dehydrogenase FAD-binding subunit